jgi:hypothetical protein
VKPDDGAAVRRDGWKPSQSLAQSVYVLSVAKSVVEKTRQERDEAEGQKKAIKIIHKNSDE